jgi:inosine/xanthosine triphosphatase
VNGVITAFRTTGPSFGFDPDTFRFEQREAESGVAETPMSIDESMRGARQRAEQVFSGADPAPTLSVGVEGGLFIEHGVLFLQSWTCLFDGERCYFGSSGALSLPSALAALVTNDGLSLGAAVDRFAQQSDIRSRQGTYGVLTKDIVTREDSFASATTFALMPYFNDAVYRKGRSE